MVTKASTRSLVNHPPKDELSAKAAEVMLGPNPFVGLTRKDILAAVGDLAGGAIKTPLTVFEHEAGIVRELIRVLAGKSEVGPGHGDRRFADKTWQENKVFQRYLQGYLALTKGVDTFIGDLGLSRKKADRAKFVVALLTEAVAPTNMLLTNPAVMKRTIQSKGKNLLAGFKNFAEDLLTNNGMPAQVDKKAFAVGKNLAISAGAVIFRNEVLELIQYQPSTEKVYARPLILVPPQINKFYVYDLAPGKSMVEYLVNAGFQVFVVSWRNPTRDHSHWGYSEFAAALIEAIAAVKEITGSKDVNFQGACSGAMTVAALLGHLAAKKDRSVKSLTQMVAVMDQDDESQIGLFASKRTIAAAKAASARKGVLEGKEMSRVFAWLRPNDLVWNYWVNNYLMGNPPPAFDILYWNNDTTRLPAKFHGQILDVFGGRLFAEPGALEVLGTPIDISQLKLDRFVVAGMTDHITPWRGCYRTARMMGGDLTMVVSSSGHIQSLINPPGNPKAKYFVNDQYPAEPDEWLQGATQVNESWWDRWRAWLAVRSGAQKKAPTALGSSRHKPIVGAPGEYVFE